MTAMKTIEPSVGVDECLKQHNEEWAQAAAKNTAIRTELQEVGECLFAIAYNAAGDAVAVYQDNGDGEWCEINRAEFFDDTFDFSIDADGCLTLAGTTTMKSAKRQAGFATDRTSVGSIELVRLIAVQQPCHEGTIVARACRGRSESCRPSSLLKSGRISGTLNDDQGLALGARPKHCFLPPAIIRQCGTLIGAERLQAFAR